MNQRDLEGYGSVFEYLSDYILSWGAVKATKYISPKLVIKASRKRFNGRVDKRNRIAEILFTIGAPNYAEREYIKKLKKAKEPFPVKKVQLKFQKVVK